MGDRGPIEMIWEVSGNSSFMAHIFHLFTPIGCYYNEGTSLFSPWAKTSFCTWRLDTLCGSDTCDYTIGFHWLCTKGRRRVSCASRDISPRLRPSACTSPTKPIYLVSQQVSNLKKEMFTNHYDITIYITYTRIFFCPVSINDSKL